MLALVQWCGREQASAGGVFRSEAAAVPWATSCPRPGGGRSAAGEVGEAEVTTTTMNLAEHGLGLTTAAAMMRQLSRADWIEPGELRRLAEFQMLFMEKLGNHLERVQQARQEHSQLALRQALHNQLQQQRQLHKTQEKHNQNLNDILQLNARLASLVSENEPLEEAVSGICNALNLADVTIYEKQPGEDHWVVRTTTAVDKQPGLAVSSEIADLLHAALSGSGEVINRYPAALRQEQVTMAIIFITIGVGAAL